MILFSLLLAYWFFRELHVFSTHLNRQIYDDLQALQQTSIDFAEFCQLSKLQPLTAHNGRILFLLCPIVAFIFQSFNIPTQLILLILLYLSLLDFHYYLTDSRYLGLIAWLALLELVCFPPEHLTENLLNSLICTAFFLCLSYITKWLFHKEMLGFGDVLLFIALSPLFNLEQMISLLLFSSLSGLLFSLGYFCKFRQKITRLPFIPFITFSTFLLFIAKLLA